MTEQEIQQALDDIAELKKSVKGHMRFMTSILMDRKFIWFSIAAAVFSGFFFSAIGLMTVRFGSFNAIPGEIKIVLAGILVLFIGLSGVYKTRIISRNIARRNASFTYRDLFRDSEFTALFSLMYAGMFAVIVTGAVIGSRLNDLWILLPFISLYYAFIIVLFAIVFLTPAYFITAGFSAAFGLAALLFMKSHHFFWLAAWMVILMLSFAGSIAAATRKMAP